MVAFSTSSDSTPLRSRLQQQVEEELVEEGEEVGVVEAEALLQEQVPLQELLGRLELLGQQELLEQQAPLVGQLKQAQEEEEEEAAAELQGLEQERQGQERQGLVVVKKAKG